MTQNPSWRHHYIPEFYLKRWMPAGSRPLTVFWRPPGCSKIVPQRVFPKQTGYVDRRIPLLGVPAEIFERAEREFYTPADSAAADVLAKMETGERTFNAVERSAWTRFIMSLIFRNPESFSITFDRLGEMVTQTSPELERRYRKARKPGMPLRLSEAMEAVRHDGSLAANALELLIGLNNSEKIGTYLVNMSWGAIQSGIAIPALLTSDRPVVINGPLSSPHAHILLPVGPKRIFLAAQSDDVWHQVAATRASELVADLNDKIVARSVKYVFGYSDSQYDYVARFMGTRGDESVVRRLAIRQGKNTAPRRRWR